jgi:signal transduction histidine kinase
MCRNLVAAGVVLADTAALVAGHRDDLPLWITAGYMLAVVLVIALGYRAPLAALVAALVLASLTGGTYVLMLWAAYHAGSRTAAQPGTAMLAGAAAGGLGAQVAAQPVNIPATSHVVAIYLVFVALPLLAGRYLAQHQRLLSALNQQNRQLRWKREVMAEQERLQERLRIARDMHDSVGHRLSLMSLQAAALEVSALGPQQRRAVGQLADTARDAVDELHELVGMLRSPDVRDSEPPDAEAISQVVKEFQAAGVPVTVDQRGEPRPLSAAAGQAAYRMIEEGLTNAAKHAPDQPVTVSIEWEPDALLLTVINALPGTAPAAPGGGGSAGHGLSGLSERMRSAGGFLDHRLSGGQSRLFAMLPTAAEGPIAGVPTAAGVPADGDDAPQDRPLRTATLGLATAALTFMVLPASMLVGMR